MGRRWVPISDRLAGSVLRGRRRCRGAGVGESARLGGEFGTCAVSQIPVSQGVSYLCIQVELDQLMSAHHKELRSRWGLTEPSTETKAATSSSDAETMDKLAEDLKKAGLGGHL